MNARTRIPPHFILVAVIVTIILSSSRCVGDEISSYTEPYRDIDVAASEVGTLAEIRVKEGDTVSAGQVLATLDNDVLQASLRIAKTAVQAHGRLNSALAEFRLHVDRLEKLSELRERNHASQQEVDRAQTQKEVGEANLESVRDELMIKSNELERIEAQIASRQLTSPIDGIVTFIFKDVGEFVSAADPAVIKVVQLDPLLAVFSAPMSTQDELTAGDSVIIGVGDESQTVTGIVEFVSPTIDGQSNTVPRKSADPEFRRSGPQWRGVPTCPARQVVRRRGALRRGSRCRETSEGCTLRS